MLHDTSVFMKFYSLLFKPLGSVLDDLWSCLGRALDQMSIHVLIAMHLHKCVASRCHKRCKYG